MPNFKKALDRAEDAFLHNATRAVLALSTMGALAASAVLSHAEESHGRRSGMEDAAEAQRAALDKRVERLEAIAGKIARLDTRLADAADPDTGEALYPGGGERIRTRKESLKAEFDTECARLPAETAITRGLSGQDYAEVVNAVAAIPGSNVRPVREDAKIGYLHLCQDKTLARATPTETGHAVQACLQAPPLKKTSTPLFLLFGAVATTVGYVFAAPRVVARQRRRREMAPGA